MNTIKTNNYDSVLPSQPRHKTLQEALGLLSKSGPTPSDAEIQQWLDEHRIEKYG
jgi:hypothetical protein